LGINPKLLNFPRV
jgi:hypothetical protein